MTRYDHSFFFAMRGAITRAAGKANKFVFVRIKMGKRRGREFRRQSKELLDPYLGRPCIIFVSIMTHECVDILFYRR